MSEQQVEITESATAYRWGKILFLPHYRKAVYIGPGYPKLRPKEYTAIQLYFAGARPVELALWKRTNGENRND